ncbi:TadA family conjugal transfer-associated ATPase [Prauserella endophytica]|uniref:TadA family conjugal transfer-associated ATPase n=1 Tax=Prauserella endophytica TaxID=1592324 RepID=A0ABY2S387_9PSEU|nr:TadA family conjugal transfer-associated ATPase [Prauserella endophytica]TKG70017.1 TadA family conjugal transfer-associated ATPase [Prauserella endophytica]
MDATKVHSRQSSATADTALVERVRKRLAGAGSGTDPRAVADAVRAETGGVAGHLDILDALRLLRHEFVGAGPLEPLLTDPGVSDVLVTAPDEVWVDGTQGLRRTEVRFTDEEAVRRLAQRLALAAGRRLDDAQPFVDGWLPGTGPHGRVRLHAVLPPIAAEGTCLSLRVLRPAVHDLRALRRLGTVDDNGLALLRATVSARLAFLVSGATGSGKSTLLAALLGEVSPAERIVCVEDAGELQPSHPQFVRLVARPPNVEGAGEVTLRELVREALRMRPDRLVVGEVRGREVCELLTAMNTGHDGGAGTLHANSPSEVPARLEALAALGGLSRSALHSQLAAAVQLVLHMRRLPDGRRVLAEIGIVQRDGDTVRVAPAWRPSGWTARKQLVADLLVAKGAEVPC